MTVCRAFFRVLSNMLFVLSRPCLAAAVYGSSHIQLAETVVSRSLAMLNKHLLPIINQLRRQLSRLAVGTVPILLVLWGIGFFPRTYGRL